MTRAGGLRLWTGSFSCRLRAPSCSEQLQEIMRGADELPFRLHFRFAAQQEAGGKGGGKGVRYPFPFYPRIGREGWREGCQVPFL